VISGADEDGNGVFNERGGRPRNSGNSPAQHALSLSGSRRVQLPRIFGRPRNHPHLTLGVNVDNLLNTRQPGAFGSVAGSSTFGRALGGTHGRSARVWMSLD
jgi:hypothetical protein